MNESLSGVVTCIPSLQALGVHISEKLHQLWVSSTAKHRVTDQNEITDSKRDYLAGPLLKDAFLVYV